MISDAELDAQTAQGIALRRPDPLIAHQSGNQYQRRAAHGAALRDEYPVAIDDAGAAQVGDDPLGGLLGADARGIDVDLGPLRWLVGRIDAREMAQFTGARLAVQALGVALLRLYECRVDEDLNELSGGHQRAREAALGAVRGDEGHQHDQSR